MPDWSPNITDCQDRNFDTGLNATFGPSLSRGEELIETVGSALLPYFLPFLTPSIVSYCGYFWAWRHELHIFGIAVGLLILAPAWIPNKFKLRYFAAIASLVLMTNLCSAFLLGLAIFIPIFPSLPRHYARFCCVIQSMILGIDVHLRDVHNILNKGKGVIITNHMSVLDSIVMGCISGYIGDYVITSKLEAKWYGMYGLALRVNKVIFLDRNNPKSAMRGLISASKKYFDEYDTNIRVIIYPEGTRNELDRNLLRFKLGGFRLAAELGVPIFPIAVSRYYFVHHIDKCERGIVICKILKPIHVKPDEDLAEVAERTRQIMQREVDEISEEASLLHKRNIRSHFWEGMFFAAIALIGINISYSVLTAVERFCMKRSMC